MRKHVAIATTLTLALIIPHTSATASSARKSADERGARAVAAERSVPVVNTNQRESTLFGTVTGENGDPIAGAKIVLQLLSTVTTVIALVATSSPEGTFVIPSVRTELEYRIRIEREGYLPYEQVLTFRQAINQHSFSMRSASAVTARASYEQGLAAYQSGNLQEAATAMAEAVLVFDDLQSNDATLLAALSALGQIKLQLGELEDAGAAFERILRVSTNNAAAHTGLGHVRDRQGDLQRASEHFKRAIELQPEDSQAHFNLGSLLVTMGQMEEAIEVLEQCLQLEESFPQAHRSLGNAYAQSGKPKQAVEHLRTYLEQMPDAPDAAQIRELIAELQGSA